MKRSLFLAALLAVACGGGPVAPQTPVQTHAVANVEVPATLRAVVDAPDRSADDRALDAGRHPGELLAYYGIAPGMHVADLAAGNGYTSELLSRAVGPSGQVFSQNNKFVLQFANEGWTARLANKPTSSNIVRVERELDDPLPPEAKELDAVVMVFFYHDSYWQKTDRAKMNAAIFSALKSGGIYGIVDHRSADGAGATQVQTLHRIEEREAIADVTKAGFVLDSEAMFLRNPDDKHDWNPSPRAAGERRGTSDRMVLKFKKP
jgi:predicted methyltransferase